MCCAELIRFVSLVDLERLGFWSAMLRLAEDRVPNVRMAVARVLQFLQFSTEYASDPKAQAALIKLGEDEDRDVRELSKTPSTPAISIMDVDQQQEYE